MKKLQWFSICLGLIRFLLQIQLSLTGHIPFVSDFFDATTNMAKNLDFNINYENTNNIKASLDQNQAKKTLKTFNADGSQDQLVKKQVLGNHHYPNFNEKGQVLGLSNGISEKMSSLDLLDKYNDRTLGALIEPIFPPQPIVQYSQLINSLHNSEGLILNKDGSLPINSPLAYFFQMLQQSEKEIKFRLKSDGFFRNLIFAEHLFSKDNDDIAFNNAVINVNVFTSSTTKKKFKGTEVENDFDNDKQKLIIPGSYGKPVFVERLSPERIKINVDNDLYSAKDSEQKNSLLIKDYRSFKPNRPKLHHL